MSTTTKSDDLGLLIKKTVEKMRPDLSPYMRFPISGRIIAVYPETYTVDVKPNAEQLSPLPGCKVISPWSASSGQIAFLPKVGEQVLIGFLDGDPTQPYIEGFILQEGSDTKMRLQWDNLGDEGESENYIEAVSGEDGSFNIQANSNVNIYSGSNFITMTKDGNMEINMGEEGIIKLGHGAEESVVLSKFLEDVFANHTHTGNNGAPTSKPNELIPPKPLDSFISQKIKTA